MGPFGAPRAASSARRARLPRHGVIVSTRPDDESNDKPDGDDASHDDASREERVRGGFHQADSSRPGGPARSHKDEDDGASDEPRRRAGRRRTDDEEDEPALGNPFGFDPAALFGRGGRIRPPRIYALFKKRIFQLLDVECQRNDFAERKNIEYKRRYNGCKRRYGS